MNGSGANGLEPGPAPDGLVVGVSRHHFGALNDPHRAGRRLE